MDKELYKVYKESNIAAIAEKIRSHTGGDKKYTVAEMADEIDTLVGGIKHRLDDIIELQSDILDIEMAPEIPNYGYVSEGLEYSFNGKSYEVIGRGSCNDSVIVIPETYDDGKNGESRVTSLFGGLYERQGAFENDQTVEEIVLPESQVRIYGYALHGSSLKILRNYSGGDTFWSSRLALEYVSFIDGVGIINYDFCYLASGVTLDFSRHTSVAELRALDYITEKDGLTILVPSNLYDEWIDSTNWVALKEYVYPVQPITKGVMEKLEIVEGGVDMLYERGIEQGKKAEYDAFWDAFQRDMMQGKPRTQYNYAFYQVGWTDVTYNPKYEFEIQYAQNMFSYNYITDTLKTIDFTKLASPASNVFARSKKLKTIRKVIVNETTTFSGWFTEDEELENLTFGGTIGQSDLNLQWSKKLSRASIDSIMYAFSLDIPNLSVTFSKKAVDKAYEVSEGYNDGSTSAEWLEIVRIFGNVTISLV